MFWFSMVTLIIAVIAFIVGKRMKAKYPDKKLMDSGERHDRQIYANDKERADNVRTTKRALYWGSVGGFTLSGLLFILACVITVPVGHAGVATIFGDVVEKPYKPGIHLANPFYSWYNFDCRQKTLEVKQVKVPSQDQLTTLLDANVQFRIIAAKTPEILDETGQFPDVVDVHMIPKVRSLLREQGKAIKNAEMFYQEAIQQQIQENMETGLRKYLQSEGVEVQAVLLRNITLPPTVALGVEAKKKRQQKAEEEKAELERFETEQQQKVKRAEAEKDAAVLDADKRRITADAKAYEIRKVNDAAARNPAYIQLQSLEAAKAMAKDPAAKLVFVDKRNPAPIMLIDLGNLSK